jgi:hypothetical protein
MGRSLQSNPLKLSPSGGNLQKIVVGLSPSGGNLQKSVARLSPSGGSLQKGVARLSPSEGSLQKGVARLSPSGGNLQKGVARLSPSGENLQKGVARLSTPAGVALSITPYKRSAVRGSAATSKRITPAGVALSRSENGQPTTGLQTLRIVKTPHCASLVRGYRKEYACGVPQVEMHDCASLLRNRYRDNFLMHKPMPHKV